MDIQKNKEAAIAFYKTAYEGNHKKAVELYVGEQYIQHNPHVEDGKEAFIAYFERLHQENPDKSIRFVRAVAEGNLVALHTHQIWPEKEYVTMDFFGFDEQGKIVEHWDTIQVVPSEQAHANGMF